MKIFLKRWLRWGFTLLELLIVLVIISVMAGLALPTYAANVERVRAIEAVRHLIAAKGSMHRYYAENGVYTGAFLNILGTNLDYNPNLATDGQTHIFSYNMVGAAGANTYMLRARRNPGGPCGAFVSPYSVFIDQAGTVTYS
jgi:type IV pilus assembly protein PilE